MGKLYLYIVSALLLTGTTGRISAQTLKVDSLKSGIDQDAYVDNSETLFVSGSGYYPPVLVVKIRPYINTSPQTDINNPTNTISINVGGKNDSLYGYVVVNGIPLASNIDSIQIGVIDNLINQGWSNYLKVDDVPPNAPSFFSITAIPSNPPDYDTVRILISGAGDNGASGTAEACTIRTLDELISTEILWASANPLPCLDPDPIDGGSVLTYKCNMWDLGDTSLFYAIKFEDNMGYTSPLKYYNSAINTKPVELSSFSAIMRNGAVTLAWRTESETDNAKWRLERSTDEDGSNPVIVYSQRKDAETFTTNFPTDYTFEDRDINPQGTYYYTLYDISLDGRETAHGPVSTDGLAIFNGTVVNEPLVLDPVEPNPVRFRASLPFAVTARAFDGAAAGRVKMEVRSMDGRRSFVVFDRTMGVGRYSGIVWDRGTAEPGVYVVQLSSDTHTVTRHLMVVGR